MPLLTIMALHRPIWSISGQHPAYTRFFCPKSGAIVCPRVKLGLVAAATGTSGLRCAQYSEKPPAKRCSPWARTSTTAVATLSSRYRSWLTNNTVPVYAANASSIASREGISMWLVGSSRIRKLAWRCSAAANCNRLRSPPDRAPTGLSRSSQANRYPRRAPRTSRRLPRPIARNRSRIV